MDLKQLQYLVTCAQAGSFSDAAKTLYSTQSSVMANLEKKVPLEWITPDGMQVTEAFEEYARPLILDEVTPVYVNGTPRHIRL